MHSGEGDNRRALDAAEVKKLAERPR